MQNAHVNHLDLRSLELLAALIETRSITRAGEAFGLSQPAASRAVAQLRLALGDPLLVRTSKGYALTPRATTLAPRLASVRRDLTALFAPETFDPATTDRIFGIATTDYGALTVLADSSRRLALDAPSAAIDVAPWTSDTIRLLEDGVLDAALYPEAPLPPDFHYKTLFEDNYVLVADGERSGNATTRKDPLLSRRVVMLYPDGGMLAEDDPLGAAGAPTAAIALRTPYFTSAIWALPGTDLVLALPRRIAVRLAKPHGLAILPSCFGDLSFCYRLVWHESRHRDPSHRWLRAIIAVD